MDLEEPLGERPEGLDGETAKVKLQTATGEDLTFYVTINFKDNRPYEIFVNVKDAKYWEHLIAVTIMISRLLQAGVPAITVAEDLKQIRSSETGHMMKGIGWVSSVYARIGMVLEEACT